jgi:hypothetical protein
MRLSWSAVIRGGRPGARQYSSAVRSGSVPVAVTDNWNPTDPVQAAAPRAVTVNAVRSGGRLVDGVREPDGPGDPDRPGLGGAAVEPVADVAPGDVAPGEVALGVAVGAVFAAVGTAVSTALVGVGAAPVAERASSAAATATATIAAAATDHRPRARSGDPRRAGSDGGPAV